MNTVPSATGGTGVRKYPNKKRCHPTARSNHSPARLVKTTQFCMKSSSGRALYNYVASSPLMLFRIWDWGLIPFSGSPTEMCGSPPTMPPHHSASRLGTCSSHHGLTFPGRCRSNIHSEFFTLRRSGYPHLFTLQVRSTPGCRRALVLHDYPRTRWPTKRVKPRLRTPSPSP